MIEKIDGVINAISGFLYQPYIVPLILIGAGLYFTIRTASCSSAFSVNP